MITNEELERWQALCDAATPGPWSWDGLDLVGGQEPNKSVIPRVAPDAYGEWYANWAKDDVRFVATARDAMPALIAEVRRLRGQQAQIQAVLRDRDDANPFATIQAILDDNEEVPHD
ncbi:hypothetical protein [Sulfobacillus harzensis]|uniref:Uncharacterized protein n=1 Tax=Sulfobacillus harzensis TaxID=2729629 RepID=A0A7Y0L3C9_9FIRM|nr:hypothetical protein [Sulfobacillus harzensis]NMP22222.1 hypothetical protein [Sulfobacillus harzensis]